MGFILRLLASQLIPVLCVIGVGVGSILTCKGLTDNLPVYVIGGTTVCVVFVLLLVRSIFYFFIEDKE